LRSGCFCFTASDGEKIYVKYNYCTGSPRRGAVIAAHGLCETADYYDEFSAFVCGRGFDVLVPDLRGHGRTAGDIGDADYKECGGHPGPDSLARMAGDLGEIASYEQKRGVGRIFLLGHSMGAVAAQLCMQRRPQIFAGFILIGVPGTEGSGETLSLIDDEIKRRGPEADCRDTYLAMFSDIDRPFRPVKTPFDWITTDAQMVADTAAQPYSYIPFCNSFYRDLTLATIETGDTCRWQCAPAKPPVLLLSGGDDTVTHGGGTAQAKAALLARCGYKDTEIKIYPGLRHSILREKDRNAVFSDIAAWLSRRA
jgi:alpha-beta hydrolase superfamily lysophospholipase